MGTTRFDWGQTPEGAVDLFILESGEMKASIATWGGVVTSLQVPDRTGALGEVTLGYASLDGYLADQCFFGCLVGRVANRIAQAHFHLDGRDYVLDRNNGAHQLHGGPQGFWNRLWQAQPGSRDGDPSLRLYLRSEDGDQGFPGSMDVVVDYTLSESGLRIHYAASTDAPTPVSLTNHMYFNLAGIGTKSVDCLGHRLQLEAEQVLEVDQDLIPSGRILPVAGTPLDFTRSERIGARVNADHPLLQLAQGYDHFYVARQGEGLARVAVVVEPVSGRRLELYTTCPGLQFYSGNHIPQGLAGRAGERYGRYSGFCLEPHGFVDAPNHPEFPSIIVRPGEAYKAETEYRFSVLTGADS
ncbi:MAG: galactose mutarotase [Proteobacteria bacterium]|nr:galactose mutarotase [Pseudomonadota bacterium]MBU1612218.1 galactose mutarotase [Pseudomonadota bacterium]